MCHRFTGGVGRRMRLSLVNIGTHCVASACTAATPARFSCYVSIYSNNSMASLTTMRTAMARNGIVHASHGNNVSACGIVYMTATPTSFATLSSMPLTMYNTYRTNCALMTTASMCAIMHPLTKARGLAAPTARLACTATITNTCSKALPGFLSRGNTATSIRFRMPTNAIIATMLTSALMGNVAGRAAYAPPDGKNMT